MAKQPGKPRGYLLGEEAVRQQQEEWAWYTRHERGGGNLPTEPFTKFGPRTFRWAKCAVNSLCGIYPIEAINPNKFPIIFGELVFDDTECGQEDAEFVPYSPSEDRIALDLDNVYHIEGDIAQVFMAHDRWYFAECC